MWRLNRRDKKLKSSGINIFVSYLYFNIKTYKTQTMFAYLTITME
jgi:hypothetical protein